MTKLENTIAAKLKLHQAKNSLELAFKHIRRVSLSDKLLASDLERLITLTENVIEGIEMEIVLLKLDQTPS